MPNHVHGVVILADNARTRQSDVGADLKPARVAVVGSNLARAGLKPAPTLSEVVRGFKTFSARRINEIRGTAGISVCNATITNMSCVTN